MIKRPRFKIKTARCSCRRLPVGLEGARPRTTKNDHANHTRPGTTTNDHARPPQTSVSRSGVAELTVSVRRMSDLVAVRHLKVCDKLVNFYDVRGRVAPIPAYLLILLGVSLTHVVLCHTLIYYFHIFIYHFHV